jgi:hypothetical protein
MSLFLTAEINALPIDGFAINGFGVTSFQTFAVAPLDGNQLSAVASLGSGDVDDECCAGVMIPPARAPARTPWGSTKWSR